MATANSVSTAARKAKQTVLIVEDDELNREMLEAILEDEYTVFSAENGRIGLDTVFREGTGISLIFLDIEMPVCNGFQFLEQIRTRPELSSIPIITTADEKGNNELKCRQLGASDFVMKPYDADMIRIRAANYIRLKEAITTLADVEYDTLTGVYTLPAFFHHAAEMLFDSSTPYDLVLADIKDFKIINGIFGEKKADGILIDAAEALKNFLPDVCIGRDGDKFLALVPAEGAFGPQKAEELHETLKTCSKLTPIEVNFGHYKNLGSDDSVSVIFDRTKMAVDGIIKNSSRCYAEFDAAIEARLRKEHEMEQHFEAALENGEFVAWFQPKVDAKTGIPVAAEALVRWRSADGSMVSPGAFIPLFEKNGMISRLDEYIFTSVCRFLKNRIDEGKNVVPVSVNLSRNSLFQSGAAERYDRIITETGLPKELVPLELTESAATGGEQVICLTCELHKLGFSLQMDDFGTGYSSLSCLVSMPFDVIKLDRSIVIHIGDSKGDLLMRSMAGICHQMGMKLVAEGVETEEQVRFLQDIGCEQIQGFYFYRPLEPEKFTALLDTAETPAFHGALNPMQKA